MVVFSPVAEFQTELVESWSPLVYHPVAGDPTVPWLTGKDGWLLAITTGREAFATC